MRTAIFGITLLLTVVGVWWCLARRPLHGTVPPDLPIRQFVTVRYEGTEDHLPNDFSIPVESRIGFDQGLLLFKAISQAGGLPTVTKMKSIRLVRKGQASPIDLRKWNPDGSNHPLLEAGDTIIISCMRPASRP